MVEDPSLTFEVFSVAAGTTNNGITTNETSSANGLPFGRIASGQVRYVAQRLRIVTNAPSGYTVNARLSEDITGGYAGSVIDPFSATNASWTTPQLWSTPVGTTPNSDTGWFGANTTDTRVAGWASASQKFGPISAVAHPVATSSGPDRGGTNVYVTYALGVNSIQPSDIYNGKIVYEVQASY